MAEKENTNRNQDIPEQAPEDAGQDQREMEQTAGKQQPEQPADQTADQEAAKKKECGETEEPAEGSFLGKKKQAAEIKKLKEQMKAQEDQLSEYRDRYARLAAEFENYKKRTAREMDNRYSDAKCDVMKGILPVIDNFERAITVETEEACKAYRQGVELIYKQLSDLLAAAGVEEIPSLGEEFNPELHNAVMHEENEEAGTNEIVEVFVKGYRMGDKVLRYSMVKVAN